MRETSNFAHWVPCRMTILVIAVLALSCGDSKQEVDRRIVECERRIPSLEKDLAACRKNEQALRLNLAGELKTHEEIVQGELDSSREWFEGQKQEITLLIPDEVKQQVDQKLDALYRNLKEELKESQKVQSRILHRVERISDCQGEREVRDKKIAELEAEIASLTEKLDVARSAREVEEQARAAALARIVEDVNRFDTRIDCRDCQDEIKINGFLRRREGATRAILDFHRELSARLAGLSMQGEP
jgi:septal ring factor EnvC (AmiA/AmiB activator)